MVAAGAVNLHFDIQRFFEISHFTFEEMEGDARAAAQKLKDRLPPHNPLAQSDLVTYLAGRTVREV